MYKCILNLFYIAGNEWLQKKTITQSKIKKWSQKKDDYPGEKSPVAVEKELPGGQ